jgi:hypothetical protein
MTDPRSLGIDARAPKSRARLGIVFAVAAALVAALFTTVSAVQPSASAATFDVPGFTWKQLEGPASLGSDRCSFTATTTLPDDYSMIAALATLKGDTNVPYVRDGNMLTLKTGYFNCKQGVKTASGDVVNGDVSPLALGKNNVAIWILGGVVGAAIGVAAALFGGPIVAAAAAAVGVTLSESAAGIIAGCLGGAVGGAIGEYIKGNDAPRMATSAILNCVGGTIVALFKSAAEASKAVAEAALELADATSAQISAAVSRVTSQFNSQLAGLTAEAAVIADQAAPLEAVVHAALREIATS